MLIRPMPTCVLATTKCWLDWELKGRLLYQILSLTMNQCATSTGLEFNAHPVDIATTFSRFGAFAALLTPPLMPYSQYKVNWPVSGSKFQSSFNIRKCWSTLSGRQWQHFTPRRLRTLVRPDRSSKRCRWWKLNFFHHPMLILGHCTWWWGGESDYNQQNQLCGGLCAGFCF